MGDALKGLRQSINSVLSVRDKIGPLKLVWVVTRRWSGANVGAGVFSDFKTQMLPTPGVVQFSQDIRVREGGAIEAGDILLTNVSKVNYPNKSDIDSSALDKNVERFYVVGEDLYNVINTKEKYLTWDVLLRKRVGGK